MNNTLELLFVRISKWSKYSMEQIFNGAIIRCSPTLYLKTCEAEVSNIKYTD